MKIRSLLISLFLLLTSNAHTFAEEIDVSQDLRILELISREEIVNPLPIDPAIPKNFIARGLDGKKNPCSGVWWGSEEALTEFFKTGKLPQKPIIFTKIATWTCQKEYGKLDTQAIEREFKILEQFSYKLGNWGDLPYAVIEGKIGDQKKNILLVGNNQDGCVYFFSLIHPNDKKTETAATALWDKFVKETKELPEPLFFKCLGQEMHIGHTICDTAGRKLLFKAEHNKKKQLVQITVEPYEGTVDFQFSRAEFCKMGANWHHEEDMVRIDGMIQVENGWVNSNQTTSVLLKKTKRFSKPSKSTSFHKVFQIGEEGKLIPQ